MSKSTTLVVLGATMMLLASARPMLAQSPPPAGSPPATTPEPAKGVTPAQPEVNDPSAAAKAKLAACAKKYAELKFYQDEGNVRTEMVVPGQRTTRSDAPFSTAFERDGRFQWEFRHSATPGAKPDQQYVVWSKAQKEFESYWTLTSAKSQQDSMLSAMAGPTGISGGSATVVVPMLIATMEIRYRTTDVKNAMVKGSEDVDGQKCFVIQGRYAHSVKDDYVKLWIDEADLIRKVEEVKTIDPAKIGTPQGASMPAFTVKTIITIKPVANQKIEDKAFVLPTTVK